MQTRTAHLYTDAATGLLKERLFRIRVVSGPDAGLELTIEAGTTVVGTHSSCDLQLTDVSVSRYHLELQLLTDGLKVTDLGSTNGTVHAGTRLGQLVLTGPARLRVGKGTELDVGPEETALALPAFADDRFGDVLGASPPMRALFALLARVAPTDATVLLAGETGTGKEAIAEALHAASKRSRGPFIVVDCGAISRELIGSELFGHVRGAFTGAHTQKEGLVAAANGGTLFLDEIGELPLDLQPQLLRVLEKREVRPIGDTRAQKVDLRVVAASHRELQKLVAVGRFREDLFFRLAVVRATVPPLRERREDLPMLARHFAAALGRGEFALPPRLLAELAAHDWPGNVRELRNVVERALSLGEAFAHDALTPPPAPIASPPSFVASSAESVLDLPFKEAKGRLVDSFEREYLVHLLARHRGNISRAADEAGIDRNYVHRLIKKHGLPVPRGAEGEDGS